MVARSLLSAVTLLALVSAPAASSAGQERHGHGQATCGRTPRADCQGPDIGNNGTKTFGVRRHTAAPTCVAAPDSRTAGASAAVLAV